MPERGRARARTGGAGLTGSCECVGSSIGGVSYTGGNGLTRMALNLTWIPGESGGRARGIIEKDLREGSSATCDLLTSPALVELPDT